MRARQVWRRRAQELPWRRHSLLRRLPSTTHLFSARRFDSLIRSASSSMPRMAWSSKTESRGEQLGKL